MRTIRLLPAVLMLAACARSAAPDPSAAPRPTRAEIWVAIQPPAARYRMDPSFIYALVAAESDFDPRARQGNACGLFQLKPAAWRAVSTAPFEPAVWDWRTNLETGIDYLAYARSYLHRKNAFSYPLLLAAFHYGMDYVEERRFDIGRIPVPDNPVYRQLWRGNLAPVPPP
jgi:soluble lytic murein transglycosylase-like protein